MHREISRAELRVVSIMLARRHQLLAVGVRD
jgi:hypothetical protein